MRQQEPTGFEVNLSRVGMVKVNHRVNVLLLLVLFAAFGVCVAHAAPRHATVASLNKNSREIFAVAMEWGDKYWNTQTALCRAPEGPAAAPANPHAHAVRSVEYNMVRESSWYALGLLLRDEPGDRARAIKTFSSILDQQYHTPGTKFDGTYRRSPNEPTPGANPVVWRDYDPNWRTFIGTTFVVAMTEYPEKLPEALKARMNKAIVYGLEGEMHEGRLLPSYTNIALMYGYLWSYAARLGGRPDWTEPAMQWQREVYRLYKQHDAFNEYNSPTYAGTDFYALALWRDYGLTEETRRMGSEMEDGLWRATAAFYNANLRNISGPYDRAYGMDMQSYVSIDGLWLRMVLDRKLAPLNSFDPPVDHAADLWFIPLMVIVDARIPEDALETFRHFTGEHAVRRAIEGQRVATAWIGRTLIYGGEITGKSRLVDADSQFHPVTAQWLTPQGTIGWLNVTATPEIDADATKQGIEISTRPGDVSFRVAAPEIKAANLIADTWTVSGLNVHLTSDAKSFKAVAGDGFVDVTYADASHISLRFEQTLQ